MRFRILALILGLMSTALIAPTALADEGEPLDTATDIEEDGTLSAAQQFKLEMIADYVAGDEADEETLAAATDQVTALREADLGWGALFKLVMLAGALGEDPANLLGEPDENGEYSIGFGELKQMLTDEQLAALADGPRNLGQLKKQAREEAAAGGDSERAPKAKRPDKPAKGKKSG